MDVTRSAAVDALAIVCPMANEADSAERFVRETLERCRAFPFRAITFFAILDRASRDGTLDLLRSLALPQLKVVYAPENRAVVDAYIRGYREALASGADWILEMDAGFSHLPQDIPRFLQHAREPWDCVFATRFARGGRYEGGYGRRYLISRLGGWLARLLLGVPLSDLTSGFQLFSRRALERVLATGVRSRGPFFQTEIKYQLCDFRIKEVPITYVPTGQAVRPAALGDALATLFRLFWRRVTARPAA